MRNCVKEKNIMSRAFGLGFLVGAGRPPADEDRPNLVAYYRGEDFPPPYEAPPPYRSVVPRSSFARRVIRQVRKSVARVFRPRTVFTVRGD